MKISERGIEMNIRLKERQEAKLNELEITTTFKIPESSFIFMKIDVEGLTVRPKGEAREGHPEQIEEPKPIKVLIPEGKTPVVCLSTGKAQFLNLDEKIQIVVLDATEVIIEKEKKGD
jgi:hypothetical protein